MQNYPRVIPRDLFNEAGLLKAVGRLAIVLGETHDHNAKFIQDQLDSFDISQDPADGSIEIKNLDFVIGSEKWNLRRLLNSRASYDLWAVNSDDDEVQVFEEDGSFTEDFLDLMKAG